MDTKYDLIFSKQAVLDLDEAFEYIALVLKSYSAAQSLRRKIDDAINRLRSFPKIAELCRDETLVQMGYRRLVVGNYVVIYSVDDYAKAVYIVRIFYGFRDYAKLIKFRT